MAEITFKLDYKESEVLLETLDNVNELRSNIGQLKKDCEELKEIVKKQIAEIKMLKGNSTVSQNQRNQ